MRKQTLTRKELVEHIRQTMPSDYDEYEKLAFIEKEVAKQISFDEKYLWGEIGTKEKIYQLAKKESQNPCKEVKRKLICITMSELFGYVVKEFGYNVKYQKRSPGSEVKSGGNEIFDSISNKKQEHVCTLVGLSDDKYIEVDIQDDLARLQTNSKPKAVGANWHGTKIENGVSIKLLDEKHIENIFRKVYQLDENERFTDDYIRIFSAMLRYQNKTPIEMLEFFMDNPKIQKELQNTKCVEANKLYKAILSVCYDFSNGKQFIKEKNKAIIDECILSDGEGRKRYSFCIYAEDDEQQVFYAYSKKSKRMVKLSREEIQQITRQAMNVKFRGRPSELKDNMISFVNGECNERVQAKTVTSLEDIFWEEEK